MSRSPIGKEKKMHTGTFCRIVECIVDFQGRDVYPGSNYTRATISLGDWNHRDLLRLFLLVYLSINRVYL